MLNEEEGFADFHFTHSGNPIVVREGRPLLTRNIFDSRTGTGKKIASFVSPENGMLTDLEFEANFNRSSLSTASQKPVNSNQHGFEHIDPQARVLNYCFQ